MSGHFGARYDALRCGLVRSGSYWCARDTALAQRHVEFLTCIHYLPYHYKLNIYLFYTRLHAARTCTLLIRVHALFGGPHGWNFIFLLTSQPPPTLLLLYHIVSTSLSISLFLFLSSLILPHCLCLLYCTYLIFIEHVLFFTCFFFKKTLDNSDGFLFSSSYTFKPYLFFLCTFRLFQFFYICMQHHPQDSFGLGTNVAILNSGLNSGIYQA